jgi:hypothetical protein
VLSRACAVASPQAGPLLLAAARTVIAFVQDPDGYKIELIERKP